MKKFLILTLIASKTIIASQHNEKNYLNWLREDKKKQEVYIKQLATALRKAPITKGSSAEENQAHALKHNFSQRHFIKMTRDLNNITLQYLKTKNNYLNNLEKQCEKDPNCSPQKLNAIKTSLSKINIPQAQLETAANNEELNEFEEQLKEEEEKILYGEANTALNKMLAVYALKRA